MIKLIQETNNLVEKSENNKFELNEKLYKKALETIKKHQKLFDRLKNDN